MIAQPSKTLVHALATISLLLTLGACSRLGYQAPRSGPVFSGGAASTTGQTQLTDQQAVANLPQASTLPETNLQTDSISYIHSGALEKMSTKDRSEASSAQYFALQTGRPGAPRNWSGNGNVSGSVTVGPFVRVNSLDCREFTHIVSVGSEKFEQKGTSCRENGSWRVM